MGGMTPPGTPSSTPWPQCTPRTFTRPVLLVQTSAKEVGCSRLCSAAGLTQLHVGYLLDVHAKGRRTQMLKSGRIAAKGECLVLPCVASDLCSGVQGLLGFFLCVPGLAAVAKCQVHSYVESAPVLEELT